MSPDQEAITHQQEQLAIHRRRLEHLFQQCATLGPYTPPYIALDIEQTQAEIRSIKALDASSWISRCQDRADSSCRKHCNAFRFHCPSFFSPDAVMSRRACAP